VTVKDAVRNWLARQNAGDLRTAREIIARREALTQFRPDADNDGHRWHENGVVWGMRLALSYYGPRPGDISDTGAEGFIRDVENADEMVAEQKESHS
jgi:hypothetical protein